MASQRLQDSAISAVRRAVGWAAIGTAVAALLVALTVAPTDAVQGNAARLIYLHVPAAWTAYLGYLMVLICSIQYLRTNESRWHEFAGAAGEIGVTMTAVTVAVGSLWGRAVWGVWWAWDPRLVGTVLMFLIYAGYLAVRQIGIEGQGRERRAALLGIAGALIMPVVHFSVVWWRSLHQPATLLAPTVHPPIDPVMAAALGLSVVAFSLAAGWVFLRRIKWPTVGKPIDSPLITRTSSWR